MYGVCTVAIHMKGTDENWIGSQQWVCLLHNSVSQEVQNSFCTCHQGSSSRHSEAKCV